MKDKINHIFLGDNIEFMHSLPDNSIDLIFADPPYWMRVDGVLQRVNGTDFDGCDDDWDNQFNTLEEYQKFTLLWLSECRRILKNDGSIWVIGSMQCIYTIGSIMQELGFWFINDVIWHKSNPTPNFKGTRLTNSHETLIWATKSSKSKYTFNYKTAKELNIDNITEVDFLNGNRKQLGSIWRLPVCSGSERIKDDDGIKLHNTQKPIDLLYRIIAITSKLNDIIFDPFGGTFTTAVVAKKMGRRFISVDQNSKYVDYAIRRLEMVEPFVGEIESASFDIKPQKVTLQEMIDDHYLIQGELFYLKGSWLNATLTAHGKLIFNGDEYDIHTCAGLANNKKNRLNGFDYWYVKRDGELVSIDKIREEYRAKIGICINA